MPFSAETLFRFPGPVAGAALAVMLSIGLGGCGGGGSGVGEQVTIVPDPSRAFPDLVAESPSASDAGPAAGARFTLSATVRNAGEGNAAAATVRFYRSDDNTITPSDTEMAAVQTPPMGRLSAVIASLSLRAPSIPGAYYYGACVAAVSGESDEENNCSPSVRVAVPAPPTPTPAPATPTPAPPTPAPQPPTPPQEEPRTPVVTPLVPTQAPPAPDMMLGPISTSNANPSAGSDLTLSVRVSNVGTRNAYGTTLRFYRSPDVVITWRDTELGHVTVRALAVSESADASFTLTLPTKLGAYYYGACVTGGGGESNFSNNCSAIGVTVNRLPAPDIVFDSVRVSNGSPAVGGIFNLYTILRNKGGGKSGKFSLRYYRSDDSTFTASDPQVGSAQLGEMPKNTEWQIQETMDTPDEHGTYYYRSCMDAPAGQSGPTSKCSPAAKIEVTHAKPDFYIGSWASGKWKGDTFGLFVLVWNIGGSSPATTLRFYHSTDRNITADDTELASVTVPALKKTKSKTPPSFNSGWVYVPGPATPGTHYYGACVGPVPDESDTTDNCGLIRIMRR